MGSTSGRRVGAGSPTTSPRDAGRRNRRCTVRVRSLTLLLVLALAATTVGGIPGAGAQAAGPRAAKGPAGAAPGGEVPAGLAAGAAIPGRWIVRFADGTDPSEAVARLARRAGPLAGRPVRAVYTKVLRGAAVTMSAADAARLAGHPEVVAVEPDRVVSLAETSSTAAASAAAAQVDPPWGLDRIDTRCTSRSTCTARYDRRYRYSSAGGQVIAYVLDTGIRASHREFRTASGTTSRVLAQVNTTLDGRDEDCNGHGTHVAGTIGGRTFGVAKNVRFRIAKVLDCTGRGSYTSVIAGLDWVRAQHRPGTRAVLNLSLGGPPSDSLDAAVRAVIAAGITVVVASGNSGADACVVSPARVTQAITVNAAERWDKDASFSNGGPCTDLHAPGVGIPSAWHTSDTAQAWKSGTSMAAPHVAGCVARLLGAQPTLGPGAVQSTIKARASTGVLTFPYGHLSGTPNRLLYCRPDW